MGREFFLYSAPVAIMIAGGALAGEPFKIDDNRLFKAAVAAERCLGHRATYLEEIRLAQAIRRDTDQPLTSLDVSSALEAERKQFAQQCGDEERRSLNVYREELQPRFRNPIVTTGSFEMNDAGTPD